MYMIEGRNKDSVVIVEKRANTLEEVKAIIESMFIEDTVHADLGVSTYDISFEEGKKGRVALENIEKGDVYYYSDSLGHIYSYSYAELAWEKREIANNIAGCWYDEDSLKKVLSLIEKDRWEVQGIG